MRADPASPRPDVDTYSGDVVAKRLPANVQTTSDPLIDTYKVAESAPTPEAVDQAKLLDYQLPADPQHR